MNDAARVIFIIFFAITFCSCMLMAAVAYGYENGANQGHSEACTSIGLEWVKDKCMKVTREAV